MEQHVRSMLTQGITRLNQERGHHVAYDNEFAEARALMVEAAEAPLDKVGRDALAGAIRVLRTIRSYLQEDNAVHQRQQAVGAILEFCRDAAGMLSTL